eukprot:GCRY01003881.1.p1 GENE.GCRY01003881.1~~GCRY01003881.1.p1  ORF type:complete len:255 (+),score=36.88 GCRY01003881.1:105-869(+)
MNVPTKKGWLKKEGGKIKTVKKRFFVLQHGHLYYFQNEEKALLNDYIRCISLLDGVKVHIVGENVFQFEIFHPISKMTENHNTFVFWAEHPNDFKEWVKALESVCNADDKEKENIKKKSIEALDIDWPDKVIIDKKKKMTCFGYLQKEGGKVKSVKRRFFMLQNGELRYYPNDKSSSEEMLRTIPLLDGTQVRAIDDSLTLELYHPARSITANHKTFRLIADNAEDFRNWKDYLQKVVLPLKCQEKESVRKIRI